MPDHPARASTWIVIAAFNERPVIAAVVQELVATYPNVVVVDDGSRDGTADAANRAGATVLRHPINRGQGAAIATGIRYALVRGAQAIVTFDADGQHRAADVVRLLEPVWTGRAEIALGSRFAGDASARRTMPRSRVWLLRAATAWTRMTTGLKISDTHNGLRALSRKAAMAIEWRTDRMAHASEILDEIRRHRLRFVEVPVEIVYSAYSLAKGQRASHAWRVFLEYVLRARVR